MSKLPKVAAAAVAIGTVIAPVTAHAADWYGETHNPTCAIKAYLQGYTDALGRPTVYMTMSVKNCSGLDRRDAGMPRMEMHVFNVDTSEVSDPHRYRPRKEETDVDFSATDPCTPDTDVIADFGWYRQGGKGQELEHHALRTRCPHDARPPAPPVKKAKESRGGRIIRIIGGALA